MDTMAIQNHAHSKTTEIISIDTILRYQKGGSVLTETPLSDNEIKLKYFIVFYTPVLFKLGSQPVI